MRLLWFAYRLNGCAAVTGDDRCTKCSHNTHAFGVRVSNRLKCDGSAGSHRNRRITRNEPILVQRLKFRIRFDWARCADHPNAPLTDSCFNVNISELNKSTARWCPGRVDYYTRTTHDRIQPHSTHLNDARMREALLCRTRAMRCDVRVKASSSSMFAQSSGRRGVKKSRCIYWY